MKMKLKHGIMIYFAKWFISAAIKIYQDHIYHLIVGRNYWF